MKPVVTPDHVVDERAGQPVERAVARLIGRSHEAQGAVLALELHLAVELTLQRAERALHAKSLPLLGHLHSVRERDGHSSDTGHQSVAPYQT